MDKVEYCLLMGFNAHTCIIIIIIIIAMINATITTVAVDLSALRFIYLRFHRYLLQIRWLMFTTKVLRLVSWLNAPDYPTTSNRQQRR